MCYNECNEISKGGIVMKKNQTLSINEEVLIEIKKAAIDLNTNLSVLTEKLYKEFLEDMKRKER